MLTLYENYCVKCETASLLYLASTQTCLLLATTPQTHVSPDAEGESEEDSVESEEETSETSNPYPLEGKFVDEADRAR